MNVKISFLIRVTQLHDLRDNDSVHCQMGRETRGFSCFFYYKIHAIKFGDKLESTRFLFSPNSSYLLKILWDVNVLIWNLIA